MWLKGKIKNKFSFHRCIHVRAIVFSVSAIKAHSSIESIKVEGYHVFKLPFVPSMWVESSFKMYLHEISVTPISCPTSMVDNNRSSFFLYKIKWVSFLSSLFYDCFEKKINVANNSWLSELVSHQGAQSYKGISSVSSFRRLRLQKWCIYFNHLKYWEKNGKEFIIVIQTEVWLNFGSNVKKCVSGIKVAKFVFRFPEILLITSN